MDIPASVLAIGRAGAGTNNIPVKKLSERGVPVFNAPGANANAVKELVIAGMLMGARNLIPAIRFVETLGGSDEEMHKATEAGKKAFAGTELPGRTLGVIGLGAIGSLVADAAIKLGMKVIGFDPAITVEAAWRLPAQVKKANSVEEVVKAADFITLHVPLLDATRNLINAEAYRTDAAGHDTAQLRTRRYCGQWRRAGRPEIRATARLPQCIFLPMHCKTSRAWCACRTWAPRPARPRRTARSWWPSN